jgi:hypothetical protein
LDLYPGICLQLRKITENLSQDIRKALGFTGPNAIRFVDLAIAGDGPSSEAGSSGVFHPE